MSASRPGTPLRWRVQPTAVALAAAAVLFVAQQFVLRSGARAWPVPVVAVGLLAFVLDLGLAYWAARRPSLELAIGPDATVGSLTSARATISQPADRRVIVSVASLRSERLELDAPSSGTFDVLPDQRGVLREAVVDLVFDGPLGLARVVRSLQVGLAEPLLVGPAPLATERAPWPPSAARGDGRAGVEPSGELTRSVREHRPGDARRQVHWPATARQGRLMTRELEQPAARVARVLVDLGPLSGADAERAAGYAAHVVALLLDEGAAVDLVTLEQPGAISGAVRSRRAVGRRLALAVPGPPLSRSGPPVLVIDPHGCRQEPAQGPGDRTEARSARVGPSDPAPASVLSSRAGPAHPAPGLSPPAPPTVPPPAPPTVPPPAAPTAP